MRSSSKLDVAYLDLKRPTAEQRFRYQRARALLIANGTFSESELKEISDDVDLAETHFGMKLDGAPIHFHEWREREEFLLSEYDSDDQSVTYRHLRLENGDIILCNRARDSDGIFTTLVEGRQSFSHVAVFVVLNYKNRSYPAVLEIQQEGVRAVPLKAFFSNRFSSYIEVFRDRSLTAMNRAQMCDVAQKMLSEPHGFDIYMNENQDVYLSCALMAAQLYRRAGATPITGKSRYSLRTLANLEILGVTCSAYRDLLMPDDYARSEALELVGFIDNGCFEKLVARALVRERMQEIWQSKVLSENLFPLSYAIIRIAVLWIQNKQGLLRSVLIKAFGFTSSSFPAGPTTFISLAPAVEARIERASQTVALGIKSHVREVFHLSTWVEISEDPRIRSLVVNAMADFEALFHPEATACHEASFEASCAMDFKTRTSC